MSIEVTENTDRKRDHIKNNFKLEVMIKLFDTFIIFILSFLVIGLFGFVAEIPSVKEMSAPEPWITIFHHIFFFSQWLIPFLLVTFIIMEWVVSNCKRHEKLIVVLSFIQTIIVAILFDAIALITGAFSGAGMLNTIQLNKYKLDDPFLIFVINSTLYFCFIWIFTFIVYNVKHNPKTRKIFKIEE